LGIFPTLCTYVCTISETMCLTYDTPLSIFHVEARIV
jgi:hypothetical protein